MLRKLEVTMPFHEVILQMPSYAKFLKDILTKKRVMEKETVALSTEVSAAILQHTLLPKMADRGSFSIPCKISIIEIDRALCDLGASVSLLPLSVYKKLNIGELKPTRMALQLADRTVKYTAGILEDVPLKVGDFYVPVDFVVLDMDEDTKIPIILGRPFLNTADVVVHVWAGRLTMKIGDEMVQFTLDQTMKQPSSTDSLCAVEILEEELENMVEEFKDIDPLEISLGAIEGSLFCNEQEIQELTRLLDGNHSDAECTAWALETNRARTSEAAEPLPSFAQRCGAGCVIIDLGRVSSSTNVLAGNEVRVAENVTPNFAQRCTAGRV
ncbi:PREDICTED: uncharacterized protein LOC104817633 [Tarenaya hassleriana]|uniref:uncharacterized protein LOC104817633 n=1 Tax=Tarenaya hassleriana TaxID=28532 RepID=UPI00053C6F20|nr:PREDICTED: uncharacterized protein LOC104817633 [Tarenaya hassleriana]